MSTALPHEPVPGGLRRDPLADDPLLDAEAADRAEQDTPVVPEDDDAPEPGELGWEADPADVLEQHLEVPFDDERTE